jgi:hypothetical protein
MTAHTPLCHCVMADQPSEPHPHHIGSQGVSTMSNAHTPGPRCEAGHCDQYATVEFGRYVKAVGIVGIIGGKVRYLCTKHGRGLAGTRPVGYAAVDPRGPGAKS